jgi:hypothetical protein
MTDITGYRAIYALTMILVFFLCSLFGFLSYIVNTPDSKAIGSKVPTVIFYAFSSNYKFLFLLEVLYGAVLMISLRVYL